MCKKCSCNLLPLRSGETLSKGLLTWSSPTRISYRNKAQNQGHFHLQRFHIQLLLLVLHGLMTWQMTNKTLYWNFCHCLMTYRSFDTITYTPHLEQNKKLCQILLTNFKNNTQCKHTSSAGVKFVRWCYLKPLKISVFNDRLSSWNAFPNKKTY